jgi:hypothetical protein
LIEAERLRRWKGIAAAREEEKEEEEEETSSIV